MATGESRALAAATSTVLGISREFASIPFANVRLQFALSLFDGSGGLPPHLAERGRWRSAREHPLLLVPCAL